MPLAKRITREEAQRIVGTKVEVTLTWEKSVIGHLVKEERIKVKGRESERNVIFFRFKPLDSKKNEVLVQAPEILRF